MKYSQQQTEEPTPEIGPGIVEEIATRLRGNTLVSDIDPMTIFPQDTPEDLEKLEARIEGWYNMLSQLGILKAQMCDMKAVPFSGTSKIGTFYLRIEQYMLLLASPGCTPELKAEYFAAIEAAQSSQGEVAPTVTITLTQAEYGEDSFTGTVSEPGKDAVYEHKGTAMVCLKFCNQFYNVRKWQCSSWRFLFAKGDPLQFDTLEPVPAAIADRIEDQKNEIILDSL